MSPDRTAQAVGASALAERFGVSRRTVYNWRDAGMPSDNGKFDPYACEQWVRQNPDIRGRGGKREGAGRPPRAPSGGNGREAGSLEDRFAAAEAVERAEQRDGPPPEGAHVGELLKFTSDELAAIAAVGLRGGLGKPQLDILERLLGLAERKIKLDQAAGQLVAAADVEIDIGRAMQRIRRAIEAVGPKLKTELKRLGVEHEVGAVIDREIAGLLRNIGGEAQGTGHKAQVDRLG